MLIDNGLTIMLGAHSLAENELDLISELSVLFYRSTNERRLKILGGLSSAGLMCKLDISRLLQRALTAPKQ